MNRISRWPVSWLTTLQLVVAVALFVLAILQWIR
jgi:hypothetical protein